MTPAGNDGAPAPPENLHATALVLGDRGVLIAGASGSGKTTLALSLLAAAQAQGRHARLVGDDRVLVWSRHGRLLCRAPDALAGLVEVFGRSPQRIAALESAVVDLVVRLVPAAEAPRFSESEAETLAGCALPRLSLRARNGSGAMLAIASWFGFAPFG